MSIETAAAPEGGAASNGTPAPVAPVVITAAPPNPPAPAAALIPAVDASKDPKDPAWLPGRLEQAKRAAQVELLKELGIDDPKAGKAALDAYKSLQEAQKSELQRAQEAAAANANAAKERDAYKARVEAITFERLTALEPDKQAIVKSLAGDDPLKISTTLDMLIPTWGKTPAAPAVPVAPQPQLPAAPAPANTAPAAAPPKPGLAKTKFDEWQDLEKKGAVLSASLFYEANKTSIEQSRPAT